MFRNATDPYLPDLLKWDCSDFVRFSNVRRTGPLVSARVVDTIIENRLTGFAFGLGIFNVAGLVEGEEPWRERLYDRVMKAKPFPKFDDN
ncbi:MAG: hypothetical protein ACI9R3_001062 [Verrucomicrobiales bacterium]|jgi:hypothetical protein